MRFKKPLKIPVFIHTEESEHLEDLGLETSSDYYDTDFVYLYSIDLVMTPHPDFTTANSCFYSGGETFISPLPIEKLNETIQKHIENEN